MMTPTSAPHGAPNSAPLSPLVFLERAAAVFPEREAIRFGERRYRYADFAEEAQHVARALAARIAPGDRVAVLSPNAPELLIAHFAVPLAGGVLVTVNTRLSADEVAWIVDHSQATVLIVEESLFPVARDALERTTGHPELVVVGPAAAELRELTATATAYSALAEEGAGLAPLPWGVTDENSVISINYTSGTTGNPKGVMYSHRGAYLNSLGFLHHAGFDGDTRYLWTLPMFHCNGWCAPWSLTAAAALHICLSAVREDAVWAAIDELRVTHLCGAPTVLSIVADAPQAHSLDRPFTMIAGGAPPSPSMIRRIEALGMTLTHAYGLTEVYGPYTICEYQEGWSALPPNERAARMARQGVSMLQSGGLRIVDESMTDVPANGETLGEVIMRGNNVMLGYFRDPDATAAAFAGGWFHSGDLGVMHPDGYIEVRDRSKDLIISGGENISSIEVENVLLAHDSVIDAAVVAVPHEKWGERPVAYVVLRAGATTTDTELRQHVRGIIAGFKVPDRVVVLDALPRTSTGKVLKRDLRARSLED